MLQVVQFCRKLNWDSLACVLEGFTGRLSFGVRPELIPLVRLGTDVMPPFRARAFYHSGIQSPAEIVDTDNTKLHAILVKPFVILDYLYLDGCSSFRFE